MFRHRANIASLAATLVFALAASARAQSEEEAIEPAAEPTEEVAVEADVGVEAEAGVEAEVALEDRVALESERGEEALPAPALDEPDAAARSHLAEQIRARETVAGIHRAFGIATWAAMAATAVLGWIQFADEYGFNGAEAQTACANNNAVLQDFCSPNPPWAHMIAGFTTAALYITTATISFLIPEPVGPNADVELHKTLRWFHMATMLATAVFGVVTANIDASFETRQALAAIHQGLGVTTFGLLTVAAGVVLF
jgi:hypothetical protein